ncbi:MAG: ChaN family lipoprotein [Bacteroidales bacterium]|jgi:uncharacterized iron-regulated protein|nr:ChaN family lipoprotein [Bacteroidales bacterium]
MKKSISIIVLTLLVNFAFAQDKPAYKLFNQEGKAAKYSKMLKDIQTADIVFFGEHHTDPISHWLQYEITEDLHEVKKNNLMIGSEMFEADQQLVLDEYLDSAFAAEKFEGDARLWPNYKTDYKPVVEFARENGLRYIATNIPRRYASMINKKGFEALDELSDEAKQYIGPDLVELYDPELNCYKEMLKMFDPASHSTKGKPTMPAASDSTKKMLTMHVAPDSTKTHAMADTTVSADKKSPMAMAMGESKEEEKPSFENYPKAQAAKDATMAHFILKNWSEGKLLFHFDGAYHSDNFEGIVWWINKLKPGLNIKTISIVSQEDVLELEEENIDKGNYIIAVPETMTQTNRK